MKKTILKLLSLLFILNVFMVSPPVVSANTSMGIQAMTESQAYHRFLNRPKNEVSKLSFLIDRFRDMGVTVIYEGHEYDADKAAQFAKKYVRENYKSSDGPAESWIKLHCYRSEASNEIIQFRFPDKKEKPVRDVLLGELTALNQVMASSKK